MRRLAALAFLLALAIPHRSPAAPDVPHPADDLEAVSRRLAAHRSRLQRQKSERLLADREAFFAETDPLRKYSRALILLPTEMSYGEYRLLLEDAAAIKAMTWKKPDGFSAWVSPVEIADYFTIMAQHILVNLDGALLLGERFLADYPESTYAGQVIGILEAIVERRLREVEGAKALPAELAEVDARLSEALGKAAKRKKPLSGLVLARHDRDRCAAANDHEQWRAAIEECETLLRRFRGEKDGEIAELVRSTRVRILWAQWRLGHFDEARKVASWLLQHEPEFAKEQHLQEQMHGWPR